MLDAERDELKLRMSESENEYENLVEWKIRHIPERALHSRKSFHGLVSECQKLNI